MALLKSRTRNEHCVVLFLNSSIGVFYTKGNWAELKLYAESITGYYTKERREKIATNL